MCPVNTQPFFSVLFNEHNGSGALRCPTPCQFAADKCLARSIILITLIAGIASQKVDKSRCALFKLALLFTSEEDKGQMQGPHWVLCQPKGSSEFILILEQCSRGSVLVTIIILAVAEMAPDHVSRSHADIDFNMSPSTNQINCPFLQSAISKPHLMPRFTERQLRQVSLNRHKV